MAAGASRTPTDTGWLRRERICQQGRGPPSSRLNPASRNLGVRPGTGEGRQRQPPLPLPTWRSLGVGRKGGGRGELSAGSWHLGPKRGPGERGPSKKIRASRGSSLRCSRARPESAAESAVLAVGAPVRLQRGRGHRPREGGPGGHTGSPGGGAAGGWVSPTAEFPGAKWNWPNLSRHSSDSPSGAGLLKSALRSRSWPAGLVFLSSSLVRKDSG